MATNGDGKDGNTKHPSRDTDRVYWFFTFNNYTDHGYNGDQILNILKTKCVKILFQEEIGESGTLHLQGTLKLIKKARLSAMTKLISDKVHWEPTRNIEASFDYCKKNDTSTGKRWMFGLPKPIKVIENLRPFQQSLVDEISNEPNDRTILWIYDPIGNMGKTQFLKYLTVNHGAVFSYGGKKADIINLVYNNKDYLLENPNPIMVYSFPRDIDPDHISYESMEQIKDGCISNTKFEAGCFVCNSPHVIVLANCLPRTYKLTADRWDIRTITQDYELVEHMNLDD